MAEPPTLREVLKTALVLGVMALLPVFLLGSLLGVPWHHPWTKPFWLDEFHTLMLSREPSFAEELAKFGQGADYNPPGLYALLRLWTTLVGPATETTLRLFSSLSAWAALVGVYVLLRQAAFSELVSLVAALALWLGNPLLVAQAFDGRFYCPWLAAAVWACNALLWLDRAPASRLAFVAVAACSVLVCATHWFGVIGLALVGAFHGFAQIRRGRGWLRPMLALAAGPAALACCAPLYFGQKAVLEGWTWVEPATPEIAVHYLRDRYVSSVASFFAVLCCAQAVLCKPPEARPEPQPDRLAGAFGLLFFPLALVLFSFAAQPVLVDRYSILCLIGWAPALALLLAPLRDAVAAVALMGILAGGVFTCVAAFEVRKEAALPAFLDEARSRVPEDALLVFPDRQTAYVAWWYRPQDRARIRIVFQAGAEMNNAFVQVETRVARRMSSLFPGLPVVLSGDDLLAEPRAVLIDFRSPETLRGHYAAFDLAPVRSQGRFACYLLSPKKKG